MMNTLIRLWRDRQGQSSAYAADGTLEEVGMSAISGAFDTASPARGDGRTELRPTWGMRLGAPLIAAVMFFSLDADLVFGFLPLFGLPQSAPFWAMVLAGWLLGWTTIQLNLFQRVIYDDMHMICEGVQFGGQSRALDGLVDIAVHPKRPALVLTFSDQPHLYIPKFISQRDRFLTDMERIIARNRAQGQRAPGDDLLKAQGF